VYVIEVLMKIFELLSQEVKNIWEKRALLGVS